MPPAPVADILRRIFPVAIGLAVLEYLFVRKSRNVFAPATLDTGATVYFWGIGQLSLLGVVYWWVAQLAGGTIGGLVVAGGMDANGLVSNATVGNINNILDNYRDSFLGLDNTTVAGNTSAFFLAVLFNFVILLLSGTAYYFSAKGRYTDSVTNETRRMLREQQTTYAQDYGMASAAVRIFAFPLGGKLLNGTYLLGAVIVKALRDDTANPDKFWTFMRYTGDSANMANGAATFFGLIAAGWFAAILAVFVQRWLIQNSTGNLVNVAMKMTEEKVGAKARSGDRNLFETL